MIFGMSAASCAPAAPARATPPPPTKAPAIAPTSKPLAATPGPATPSPTPKPAAEKPRYGGVLNIFARTSLKHYDIHQNSEGEGIHPFQHAYNNMVQYDSQEPARVIGDLAQSWEVSPDGTVFTFRLNKGVKWHDGKPFTSADAKFSLDRMYNPPKGIIVPKVGELMGAIKNVEAPDADTVKVTLKYPSASFIPSLAVSSCAIFPKHVIEEMGDMKRTLMGTGPFKFKRDIPDNSFELAKNKEYFKEGRPYLDGITYYIIKDPATRFAAFRTKRILLTYVVFGFMPSQMEQVKRELPEVTVAQIEGGSFYGYYFLTSKTPWNDVRIRRAISLALDRQEAVRILEENLGSVAGPMPPGPWALPENEVLKLPGYRQPKDQDRAEAKRLLGEAGYGGGLRFTLLYRAGTMYQNAAEFFKDQVAKVGVEVTIKAIESTTLYDMLQRRDFDAAQMKLAWTLYDPDDIILQYYRSKTPRNYGDFSDPEVDKLIDEQARTMDQAKRKEVVTRLQWLILEKLPFVQMHWVNAILGWWPEVRNFKKPLTQYSYWRLEDVWLAR